MRAFLLVLTFLPALACALLVERHAPDDGKVWLGWLTILALAVLVHLRLRRTLDPRGPSLPGMAFLANLLLFSPLQWENLLSSAQPFPRFLLESGAAAEPVRGLLPVLLGSPGGRVVVFPTETAALVVGLLVAASFLAGVGYWLVHRRGGDLFRRGLPWVVLGGVGFALCVAVVLGRADVLVSRYVSLALWFWLAALALGALVVGDLRRRGVAPGLLDRGPAFVAGFLGLVLAHGWLVGIAGMREWESARLRERTAQLYAQHFGPGGAVTGSGLDPFAVVPDEIPDGRIVAVRLADDDLFLRGHAWIPEADRRADGVLLTLRQGEDERRVVALAAVRGLPWFVVEEHDHVFNELQRPNHESMGAWTGRVPLTEVSRADAPELEAWAVDAKRMRVWRLPETVVLERGPDGPRARVLGERG